MTLVIFVNALVAITMAALMAITGAIFSDAGWALLESASDAGVIGFMVALATLRPSYRPLRRGQTFILTASVWLTGAATGALPLWYWGLGPVDALFEAMSGLTTTGSTVMSGLDTAPHAILMWRAVMQAVGGIGFVVTGIALLPLLRIGGMQLFRTESSEKGQSELAGAAQFAKGTLWIYAALILASGLVYRIGGMSGFDAAVHAMTTLSSGGFSNYDNSFGQFDSAFLQWAATGFMLSAGLPFAWYIRAVTRARFDSEQIRAFLLALTATILVLTVWLAAARDYAPLDALRLVAFNVVSVVTTTGYASTDYTAWGTVAVAAFFFLTALGGCTGSTAGGVKFMRWLILVRALAAQIRHMALPHAVVRPQYEGRPVSDDVMSGVIGFFTFFALTFGILSILLAFDGLDMQTAMSGALTALANVGPGVGPVIGPAGNFGALDNSTKLLLALGMYLGRLELMTVLVLVTPTFWSEF